MGLRDFSPIFPKMATRQMGTGSLTCQHYSKKFQNTASLLVQLCMYLNGGGLNDYSTYLCTLDGVAVQQQVWFANSCCGTDTPSTVHKQVGRVIIGGLFLITVEREKYIFYRDTETKIQPGLIRSFRLQLFCFQCFGYTFWSDIATRTLIKTINAISSEACFFEA